MDEEFTALMRNGTWSLVPTTPGLNVIDSMWIFKSKRRSDGSLERKKVGLLPKVITNNMELTSMICSTRL
jgi:hypothetical protein